MPLIEVSTLDLEETQLPINFHLLQHPVVVLSPSPSKPNSSHFLYLLLFFFFLFFSAFDFTTCQDSTPFSSTDFIF
ncbi:hypothetical protein Hanom_Chr17g01548921 [Helianthus anomalus]